MKKILITLLILVFVVSSGCEELDKIKSDLKKGVKDAKLKSKESTTKLNVEIEESGIQLKNEYWDIICNEDSTELQLKELNEKLNGQEVIWKGKVEQITPPLTTGDFFYMYVKHCTLNDYGKAQVEMKSDQKEKLLKYKKGDQVIYKGTLEEIGSFLDIRDIHIDDGEIME